MKNPLNKRLPRELKKDFGKYFVIFAFMVILIGAVSGFMVASHSMMSAYDEAFDKYNVEHGHFTVDKELDETLWQNLEEQADITIYDLRYINVTTDNDRKLRIYKNRDTVNKVCLMKGELPQQVNELAIDRLFATKNHYKVGDEIVIQGDAYEISGIVALPDYSCLYEKNTDTMFNAKLFTVAIMSEGGFEQFDKGHMEYNYAWKYNGTYDREDDKLCNDKADELLEVFKDVVLEYDTELLYQGIEKAFGPEILAMVKNYDVNVYEIGATQENLLYSLGCTDDDVAAAQGVLDQANEKMISFTDFVPQYLNQAIIFAGEDIGTDAAAFLIFNYLVVIVIAFVFAVTISNTIIAEAGVIGTLRASGYSKGELLRHYMVLPVLVTLIAALVGNVCGYTFMKHVMAGLYYNSYSLTTYVTLWDMDAFIKTTVVPIILMFIINAWVIMSKLSLSPIRFLRRDLSKRGKKKAFRLNTKIPFLNRFRVRVIFQNMANYVTLFFGIFLGAVLTIFGLMFGPMLDDYRDTILEQRICDYQYVVMSQDVETENSQAEKYSTFSLKTSNKDFKEDEISIYGMDEDSQYLKVDFSKLSKDADGKYTNYNQVIIASAYQKKYGLSVGDKIELVDTYTDTSYTFEIAGVQEYEAGIVIFMPRKSANSVFGKKEAYYSGFFSNEELVDLDEKDIATVITCSDLTKAADQLTDSMGAFTGMMKYFGIIMFILLMYLLSKQVIEKNAQSISMTKILGFYDGEIGSIYIAATALVVVLSLFIICPLTHVALKIIFVKLLYSMMSGYIPFNISGMCYVETFIIGALCFTVVAWAQMRKIRRIPKVDALKNVE